ncbi:MULTISPECIES: DUF4181 domain-containing protein [Bacillus cereus group]
MEWKYGRESKEYVISFLFILFYIFHLNISVWC